MEERRKEDKLGRRKKKESQKNDQGKENETIDVESPSLAETKMIIISRKEMMMERGFGGGGK